MLLILAVMSFMGIWSQDRQPGIAAVIARHRAATAAAMAQTTSQPAIEPAPAFVVAGPVAVPRTLSFDGVAPGQYRAVNHRGESRLVDVTPTTANEQLAPREFYTQDVDGARWYLIRVNGTMTASRPQPVTR